MKKHLLALVTFLLATIAGAAAVYASLCYDGDCSFGILTNDKPITSFEECAAADYPVTESYPRQCRVGSRVFTEEVPAISSDAEAANIRVYAPTRNAAIKSPVLIRGEARVFENQFAYRIKDADGTELASGTATANAGEVGLYVGFELTVSFPMSKGDHGTLEVFQYSAKDGQEIDKVAIPIKFSP